MPQRQPEWLRDLTRKLKQKQAGLPVPYFERSLTLDGYRRQLEQMISPEAFETMRSIPGMKDVMPENEWTQWRRDIARIGAMISAMTLVERLQPSTITSSRRRRIARGSGVPEADVEKFLSDFQAMQRMMATLPSATPFEFESDD